MLRLKEIREKYDLTQREIAKLLNVVNVKYFCRFLVKKIVGFW